MLALTRHRSAPQVGSKEKHGYGQGQQPLVHHVELGRGGRQDPCVSQRHASQGCHHGPASDSCGRLPWSTRLRMARLIVSNLLSSPSNHASCTTAGDTTPCQVVRRAARHKNRACVLGARAQWAHQGNSMLLLAPAQLPPNFRISLGPVRGQTGRWQAVMVSNRDSQLLTQQLLTACLTTGTLYPWQQQAAAPCPSHM
jgi:hypothetical protein